MVFQAKTARSIIYGNLMFNGPRCVARSFADCFARNHHQLTVRGCGVYGIYLLLSPGLNLHLEPGST